MRLFAIFLGLGTLLVTTACEHNHHYRGHHRGGYQGGSYDRYDQSWGRGEYRGYPNYRDYRYDRQWDRR